MPEWCLRSQRSPRTDRAARTRRRAGNEPLRSLRAAIAAGLGVAIVAATYSPADAAKPTPNPVTPGNFTGLGFDQCIAPTQSAMNAWLNFSPFLAVGIYISGDSRGCRSQPNLSKKWVRTQLANGWRLLPITLGPQASCSGHFPRYGSDETINPAPGTRGRYPKARRQGIAEANTAVAAAKQLGIIKGSTLWYDLESFTLSITNCRESALRFVSGWTTQLHKLGYVSGFYSSSGSGIKMIDDARVQRPNAFTLPDQIWIARWDGKANTHAEGIRRDGWHPGGRMKQFLGGHNETYGGVTINIDRNWLDLGKGSHAGKETHCGGVNIDSAGYPVLTAPTKNLRPDPSYVSILKCVMSERAGWKGNLKGTYGAKFRSFLVDWKTARRLGANDTVTPRTWMALFASGTHRVVKSGSAGPGVRDLQRALNAADPGLDLVVDGVFGSATGTAVTDYQKRARLIPCAVANVSTWKALSAGAR